MLTLNRPERNNAWTPELEVALFDAADACEADPDVRVIVLTGVGRSFCPGMDSAGLAATSSRSEPPDYSWRTRPVTHLRSLRKPTIAMINGGCAGIGLVQALCCDIRVCAAEARLATAFARRGLIAEFGAAWLLTRLIGQGAATELLLSGAPITAGRAREIGLVTRVHPRAELAPAVLEFCADLARNCSPRATSGIKDQLDAAWDQSLAEAETDAYRRLHDIDLRTDFAEGVSAFRDGREPRYRPLS